ncbi:hypothetical protein DFJ73DRAFT_197687 [Zopfochytrium polystomum]|nr:hypothetical protein DFJ73DRAFT_197687 [Zopfochytrium polystomum]
MELTSPHVTVQLQDTDLGGETRAPKPQTWNRPGARRTEPDGLRRFSFPKKPNTGCKRSCLVRISLRLERQARKRAKTDEAQIRGKERPSERGMCTQILLSLPLPLPLTFSLTLSLSLSLSLSHSLSLTLSLSLSLSLVSIEPKNCSSKGLGLRFAKNHLTARRHFPPYRQ